MFQRKFLHALIGLAAILILSAPHSAGAYDYGYARIVRLSLVQGDVKIARPNQNGWETAVANMPIEQGFTVATSDGRAEVEFESGAMARLAENTVLQFTELALSDGGRITRLTVNQGTASFYANLKSDDSFSVATPQVQVTIPHRSEFRVDVFSDGSSVSVFQGNASVSTPAGSHDVNKGQTLAYNASAPNQVRIEKNPSEDNWDRWVDNRENTITTATNQTLQYTSAPFNYGLADLSSYGAWNYFAGYGYGWQPWGLGAGWAPFWNGFWSFYPGLGWTWVSYEPWGWVPYHFGSWAYSPLYGWLWLPGYYGYWCPAPVQWVAVGNRVGWTPVRPGPAPVATGAQTPRPAPPVIVGGGKLGAGGRFKILPGDQLDGELRVLPAPPQPNGKMPPAVVSEGGSTKVLPATAFSGGGKAVVVPTEPGLAHLRAGGVVFDPAEHRFVTGNSASASLPASTVVANAAPRVTAVPRAPVPVVRPFAPGPIMPSSRVPLTPPAHTLSPAQPRREFHQPPPPPPPPHAEPHPHAMVVEPHFVSPPPASRPSGVVPHRSA